ncbi:hypothetical protein K8I85_09790, partial [bacterium]|nr:hypothetical protein [bacterium]
PLVRRRTGTEAERVFRGLVVALTGDTSVAPVAAARPRGSAGRIPGELPSVEGLGVDMVIVTTAELESAFQPLADWKTAKGIVTVVRSVEWIEANYPDGQDTTERIRHFLRDAYEKWGIYLVLLGGDYGDVPPRVVSHNGSEIPTDQYFACLDGTWNADGDRHFGEGFDETDLYPDLFLGRAPVETPAEASVFVGKSLVYDTSPPSGYVEDFCALAEVLFPDAWTCGQDPGTITTNGKAYAESLDVLVPPAWDRSLRFQSDCDLDRNIALAELSAGHHIVSITGHGDAFRFSVGNGVAPFVFASDADTLTNGNALTFLVSVACSPNQFDTECVGEAFMNNPIGGTIAVSASTRVDYPGAALRFRQAMFRAIFERGITRFGVFDQVQRLPFITSTYGSTNRWQWLTGILFGDPELRLWQREPVALAAAHAASVGVADPSVTVTVTGAGAAAVPDALVCLTGSQGTYARGRTDAAGQVTLPLDERAPGALATIRNAPEHRPYDVTIPVTAARWPRRSPWTTTARRPPPGTATA